MLFEKKQIPQSPSRKPVEDSRFSMELSSEWVDKTSYIIVGPEEDGIQHNIIVKIENNVDIPNIATLVREKVKDLSGHLELFRGLNHEPVQLNQSYPAYEVAYKWTPAGKREVYQRMMFVLANQTVYTLTVTFSEKTFKRLGPHVSEIYKSFTVMSFPGHGIQDD